MGKIVTVHSYRGGTGKTITALNLATLGSVKGKDVCLLELDFRAPTLYTVFDRHADFWMNDFLDGRCEGESILIDFAKRYGTEGRLLVGMANPRMEAIRVYLTRGRRWQMSALRRLLSLCKKLSEDMEMDYTFIDSSPGIAYSSLNAIVAADLTIVITSLDRSDLDGTSTMIRSFYDVFGKKTLILVNKAIAAAPSSGLRDERRELLKELSEVFASPVIGIIPCYCDVLNLRGPRILVSETFKHPIVDDFNDVLEGLERL